MWMVVSETCNSPLEMLGHSGNRAFVFVQVELVFLKAIKAETYSVCWVHNWPLMFVVWRPQVQLWPNKRLT